jgi:hypothetical protein
VAVAVTAPAAHLRVRKKIVASPSVPVLTVFWPEGSCPLRDGWVREEPYGEGPPGGAVQPALEDGAVPPGLG